MKSARKKQTSCFTYVKALRVMSPYLSLSSIDLDEFWLVTWCTKKSAKTETNCILSAVVNGKMRRVGVFVSLRVPFQHICTNSRPRKLSWQVRLEWRIRGDVHWRRVESLTQSTQANFWWFGLSQLMRSSAAIGNFLVKVDYVPRFGNAIRCLENFWPALDTVDKRWSFHARLIPPLNRI